MPRRREVDVTGVTTLLCDADGNLFPSEEPAFVASTVVTNRFVERFGLPGTLTPTGLRLATTGKNFRTTAVDLVVAAGVALDPALAARRATPVAVAGGVGGGDGAGAARVTDPDRLLTEAELEWWVDEEKRRVTAHLGAVLRPDPAVLGPVTALGRRFRLAAVSSSAAARLDACFAATGLDGLFPAELRFSAEDSLPVPTSKPDPAVYLFAAERLGISAGQGLAIEDSVPGAQSAVAAGFTTVGNVVFVPPAERDERVRALREVGVGTVVSSWREFEELLTAAGR